MIDLIKTKAATRHMPHSLCPLFLILGAVLLGERRWVLTIVVALIATGAVWWLVDRALGIFLRPLPFMFG